jgi:hypothetical protein
LWRLIRSFHDASSFQGRNFFPFTRSEAPCAAIKVHERIRFAPPRFGGIASMICQINPDGPTVRPSERKRF